MKTESIWTSNEGHNVLYVLRQRYGDLDNRTLIKYAVREIVELQRVTRQARKIPGKLIPLPIRRGR